MEILLRVNWTDTKQSFDVAVNVEASHTVEDLTNALVDYCDRDPRTAHYLYSSTGEPLHGPTLASKLNLISGDELHVSHQPNYRPNKQDETDIRIAVVAGPDAGVSIPLPVGHNRIGRNPACELALSDLQATDIHLEIERLQDNTITLKPAVLGNEIRVNGQAIEDETTIETDDLIHFGTTALAIRNTARAPLKQANLFGYLPFHRAPYFPKPITEREFKAMGNVPKKPEPRRFQFLAAITPIIGGVAMAVLFDRLMFLIFTALSPIMIIGNFFDARKQGKRRYKDQLQEFRKNLAERKTRVRGALDEERSRRVYGAPDIEDLKIRAQKRMGTLWVRDRESDDFLVLRTGVGDIKPSVDVQPETSGEEELQQEAAEELAFAKTLKDVPFTLKLKEFGTIALTGSTHEVSQIATSLALQAGCLHSPEDLVVVAAVSQERGMSEWLKWLPHTRTSSSPLTDPHLVVTPEEANDLLRRLLGVAETRSQSIDRNLDPRWPWLLFFLDLSAQPDAAVLSKLLDLCPQAGISIIWLSGEHEWIPRQATAVLQASSMMSGQQSEVTFTDPDTESQKLTPERISQQMASTVSQSLAPVQDASSSNSATAIPKVVPLFNALNIEECSAEYIAQQWSTDRGYSLQAPIGMTETGPMVLDMVEHGPHGLIGGTSGAGKSELVQSIVANLIAYNPPTKINFLFVDYKGGASSDLFKDVPHTVGYVTNLDAILSLRALTSLTAELNRRMALLQGKAKDLAEMIEKFPDEAPPSLVIVVDEFATLVKALPDFVDGMVDIAQRGRSLGIHLILSTQRPSGAVNENILANTNLRISLRMLDSAESNSVIGTPDAAAIPGPLKGRGYARLGPGELIPFQSAWSGAPVLAATGPPPVDVRPFSTLPDVHQAFARKPKPPRPTTDEGSSLTQVDVLLDAAAEAANMLNMGRGRSPWQEVLPTVVSLDALLTNPRSEPGLTPVRRSVVIGMIDDPAAQDQYPAVVDLEAGGGLLIFGIGGSGKSTLLRTIALSASIADSNNGGNGLTIFALDFASRELAGLAKLPQCAAIATGDDLEAVTRIIDLLTTQLEQRRSALAAASSRGESAPKVHRVLLLLDGFENLVQTMEQRPAGSVSLGPWLDRLNGIITEGRQVGIHVVLAAGRRGAVRNNIMSVISSRIVLSQAEDSGYMELGVPVKMAKGIELEPGRGFINGSQIVQVASWTGREPQDGSTELESVNELAETLQGSIPDALATEKLPETVPAFTTAPTAGSVQLGISDMSLDTVGLSYIHNHVVVTGQPRSGRSFALMTIAQQALLSGTEVWLFGSTSSPLTQLTDCPNAHFGKAAKLVEGIEALNSAAETFAGAQRLVCFDDVDLVDDASLHTPLKKMLDLDVRVIGSVTSLKDFSSNPVYQELKKARSMLYLMPDHPRDIQDMVGILPPIRPGVRMVPGRGVVIENRVARVLQVALPKSG